MFSFDCGIATTRRSAVAVGQHNCFFELTNIFLYFAPSFAHHLLAPFSFCKPLTQCKHKYIGISRQFSTISSEFSAIATNFRRKFCTKYQFFTHKNASHFAILAETIVQKKKKLFLEFICIILELKSIKIHKV